MRHTANTRKRRLEKECDRLWQEVMRLMFNETCARCKGAGVTGHHIRGRRTGGGQNRHNILNGLYLCDDCHMQHAHKSPEKFSMWLFHAFPLHWLHYKESAKIEQFSYNEIWLEEKREELKEWVAKLSRPGAVG